MEKGEQDKKKKKKERKHTHEQGLHLHISMGPKHNEEMNEHEARSRESP